MILNEKEPETFLNHIDKIGKWKTIGTFSSNI